MKNLFRSDKNYGGYVRVFFFFWYFTLVHFAKVTTMKKQKKVMKNSKSWFNFSRSDKKKMTWNLCFWHVIFSLLFCQSFFFWTSFCLYKDCCILELTKDKDFTRQCFSTNNKISLSQNMGGESGMFENVIIDQPSKDLINPFSRNKNTCNLVLHY